VKWKKTNFKNVQIANGTSMPFWGKISDIFGRKPIIMIANIIFLVGSPIAALSKNLNMLLAGRAIQGLGAGGLMVLPNIVICDLYSIRDRGLYFGLIGAVWSFATSIGPVIGGAFAQTIGWRWCFWINRELYRKSSIMLCSLTLSKCHVMDLFSFCSSFCSKFTILEHLLWPV
jgi:MFS family permease